MSQRAKPSLSVAFLFLLLHLIVQPANSKGHSQHSMFNAQYSSGFRYIIHGNEINNQLNRREVTVLMEREALTENNLKKLFYLISTRFPEPHWLFVSVATSLWQISTPEEIDEGPSPSGSGKMDPHYYLYLRAVMIRQDGNELFRYTTEGPPYVNFTKTVILRGKDPNP